MDPFEREMEEVIVERYAEGFADGVESVRLKQQEAPSIDGAFLEELIKRSAAADQIMIYSGRILFLRALQAAVELYRELQFSKETR